MVSLIAIVCMVAIVTVVWLRLRRERVQRISRQKIILDTEQALRDTTHAALRDINSTIKAHFQRR